MSDNELKVQAKCAAVFGSHQAAETAVKALAADGFDMGKLSIIGRDYHSDEQVVGFYNGKDRVKYWGRNGAFWGGLFGILFAPAFFFIPGIGPILTGGLFGSALMGLIEGGLVGVVGGGGLSALAAGFMSIGIPKDSVVRYQAAIKADKFLLLVHGSADDVSRAHALLEKSADSVNSHPAGD